MATNVETHRFRQVGKAETKTSHLIFTRCDCKEPKIVVSGQSFQLYTHYIVMFAPVILSRKWDTEVFVLAKIVSPIVLFFSRVYWGIYVPQT